MIKKLKVAIDKGPFKGGDVVRGIGFHSRHLIEEFNKIKEFDFELVDAKGSNLEQYSLVHFQKFNPFFLSLPLNKVIKSVITIHDLIPLVYPKQYPSGARGKLIFQLQKMLVRKMDAIITISETSKKDICRFLEIDPQKVKVIYLAADKNFRRLAPGKWMSQIKTRYSLPDKFILYVGDVNYNKNILTLAEAAKVAKMPLVIVGKQAAEENFDRKHVENKPFARFLEKYGRDKDIKRLGFVEDNDLIKIYNLATVYCQPSFYEGFGLPLLEAFATGTPIVASKNNCHVEIGGDAVLLADPKSPQDMAEKITQVLKDEKLRKDLITKGETRAKKFDWGKTAKDTYDVYKSVIGSR